MNDPFWWRNSNLSLEPRNTCRLCCATTACASGTCITLSMCGTCRISTVFGIFWIMGTCVASQLTSSRSCHCAVRGTCLCLFTEMLSTMSIDCTWCISTVLGERFGLLELSSVTTQALQSLCRCTAPQESRRACQTGWSGWSLPVGSLSDPGFVFCAVLRIRALYLNWHNS